jgi:hypothetical protein
MSFSSGHPAFNVITNPQMASLKRYPLAGLRNHEVRGALDAAAGRSGRYILEERAAARKAAGS